MRAAWFLVLLLLAGTAEAAGASCSDVVKINVDGSGKASCSSQGPAPWVLWSAAGFTVTGATWAWLGWLRWLPIMGGFTRLRQDSLLDHPRRAELMEAIQSEPGIHHSRLADRTGMGQGQLSHHLSMMVRAGLLTAVRRGKFTTYFVKGTVDAPIMQGMHAVRSRAGARALQAISHRPGIALRPLAKQVGCSESTLRHHVRRLRAAGLVEGTALTPVGEAVVARLPEDWAAPRHPPGMAV